MIGKLSGIVDYVASDHVLLDCGGVGYVVYCAPGTLSRLPPPGGAAALYIDTVVREDLIQLFGFPGIAEREWHRLLTSVQGVGAKVSMALLGALGSEGVARALARGDAAAVRAAPGVGPKLASRIVNELQSKAPDLIARTAGTAAVPDAPATPVPTPAPSAAPAPEPDPDRAAMADALSALVNLGYDRVEAADAVASVEPGDAAAMIRAALRHLAPKS